MQIKSRKQVFKNAVMSVLQIIVNGGILFFLYKYLLHTLGVEQLGMWSLILATTSITHVANFGLSGSVVKHVAKYLARGEDDIAVNVIQTASISVSIFFGLSLIGAYPLLKWVLSIIIAKDYLAAATAILPYSLVSFWLMANTGIFQSGLDGCHRIDIRNYLTMGGAILYFFLCILVVPKYGLIGVAYSQILQNLIVLLCTWIVLRSYLNKLPIIPRLWDKRIFKEIMHYGINFQAISMAVMFYDPITKALLSKFGGLSMVGYYEMANKIVTQFRALIISANQVLVPTIANLQENIPEKIIEVYRISYQLLFYLALPLYSLILIFMPVIAQIWIGYYEVKFVTFGMLLSVGAFLNTLAGPAYFANLGTGELRWNLIGHITIGILNIGLGFTAGAFFGGIGVVVAWIMAFAIGSSVIYISYHIKYSISFRELIPPRSRIILIICLLSVIININIYHIFNGFNNKIIYQIFINILFMSIILLPMWLHPMRKRIFNWLGNYTLEKKNSIANL